MTKLYLIVKPPGLNWLTSIYKVAKIEYKDGEIEWIDLYSDVDISRAFTVFPRSFSGATFILLELVD